MDKDTKEDYIIEPKGTGAGMIVGSSGAYDLAQEAAKELLKDLGIKEKDVAIQGKVGSGIYKMTILQTGQDDEYSITVTKLIAIRKVVTHKTHAVIDMELEL